MEYYTRKKNPEGVEMQLAQDGAKPGPPTSAGVALVGVGSGVLGKVEQGSESRRDGTGFSRTASAVSSGREEIGL